MTGENDKKVLPFGKGDKTFKRVSDNPHIEVLSFSKTSRTMEPCSFYAAAVLVRPAGPDKSSIALPDGTTITVSLPYKELYDRIEEGLSPMDLKEYCEKVIPEPPIGEKTQDGQSVYLGQYVPKDRDGNSLGKIFNVFAAPQDLTDASGKKETFKYVNAVKRIAELKNWNGFDGTNYATDKEIYQALKDGSYNGGWIIPTRDLLSGKDVDGNATTPDNLHAHKNTGALAGTFTTAASGSGYPGWYWSSTENRDDSSGVHGVRFSDGYESWDRKDSLRLSCRPVRLVAASAPSLG
ncbi:MAG: hypothetical protein HY052_02140 [Proteobacteria bacterium]|nr:hypothetical protein [Pseudomonadota bacterium]